MNLPVFGLEESFKKQSIQYFHIMINAIAFCRNNFFEEAVVYDIE